MHLATSPALKENARPRRRRAAGVRAADIEQTLELGAHGPRRLHVVVVDDEGATA
jgi:L-lactate utilization protein LutC